MTTVRSSQSSRPPLWAYLHLALQFGVFAAVAAIAFSAFPDVFDHLVVHAYGLGIGVPLAITAFLPLQPRWFYEKKEPDSGIYDDPTLRVRVWIVALHAVWMGMFIAAMWWVSQLTDDGTLTPWQGYQVFLTACGVTFAGSVALRIAATTSDIPLMSPCPFCGKKSFSRNVMCPRCRRDRPPFWWEHDLNSRPSSRRGEAR